MADFPAFDKNATKPTQPLEVSAPAFIADDSREVSARVVDQQWRDVARTGVHKTHPLSLNRDSANVTADPYSS